MMGCVDGTEGLSASGQADPAALAAHLGVCSHCAQVARRDAQFDRLWEVTRPEEPTASAWATVWANVTQSLEVAPSPQPSSSFTLPRFRPSNAWRRGSFAAFAIAQAAVLLVGAFFVSRPDGSRPHLPPRPALAVDRSYSPDPTVNSTSTSSPAVAEIQIDDGELVLIRSEGMGIKVVSRTMNETSSAVDSSFVALGLLEALAE